MTTKILALVLSFATLPAFADLNSSFESRQKHVLENEEARGLAEAKRVRQRVFARFLKKFESVSRERIVDKSCSSSRYVIGFSDFRSLDPEECALEIADGAICKIIRIDPYVRAGANGYVLTKEVWNMSCLHEDGREKFLQLTFSASEFSGDNPQGLVIYKN